jgi:hypothetical protein
MPSGSASGRLSGAGVPFILRDLFGIGQLELGDLKVNVGGRVSLVFGIVVSELTDLLDHERSLRLLIRPIKGRSQEGTQWPLSAAAGERLLLGGLRVPVA